MVRTYPLLAVRAAPRAALAVTPQMKLALELLALPAVELAQRLEAEALANPALELDGDETGRPASGAEGAPAHEAEAVEPAAGRGGAGEPSAPDPAASDDPGAPPQDAASMPFERSAWPREAEARDPQGEHAVHRAADRLEVPGPRSLAEHLQDQLIGSRLAPRLRRAVDYLIGCLDDRGRLLISAEEAAGDLGVPPSEIEAAAAVLRGLDPPGIGARDLRECLLLQLRARGRIGSPAWRLLDEAFDLLAARRLGEASRRLAVPPSALAEGLAEIRRLVPHPGRLFAADPVRYIVPDLVVRRVGSGLAVDLGDRAQPRLRVGRIWSDLASGRAGGDPVLRAFAARRGRAARRLIRAVDRRRMTLVRVMECIVLEQSAFFDRGTAGLRPMRLRTVAERLGLHESTVARVVRGKHVETPLGLFPLRHFFSGGLDRSGRPGTSARAVRARIREWIGSEAPERPLTDEALAARLQAAGLSVARRTVAKYRKSLGIEQARLRRLRPRRAPGGAGPEAAPGRHNPLGRR